MTCIVALEHDDKVYMGSDSAAAAGWHMRRTAISKIFEVGAFTIGFTRSFRMGQLLEYGLTVRERKPDEKAMTYMVTGFIPAVRECLAKGGYTKIENNREETGEMLVVYDRKVYSVYSDLQVNCYLNCIAAVGCGQPYALASLATTMLTTKDFDPRKAVMNALEIAGMLSNGVCRPFQVVCIQK